MLFEKKILAFFFYKQIKQSNKQTNKQTNNQSINQSIKQTNKHKQTNINKKKQHKNFLSFSFIFLNREKNTKKQTNILIPFYLHTINL